MESIITEEMKIIAISKFYNKAIELAGCYKRGGKQKLQKIVGTELLFQKGKSWWWDNSTICDMDYDRLVAMTTEIERVIKNKKK